MPKQDDWENLTTIPQGTAAWWVEAANLLDRLRENATTTLYLGDIPTTLKSRAHRLNEQSERLVHQLLHTRLRLAEAAGNTAEAANIATELTTIWTEWCRHQRRISNFLTDAHWRDLGTAG